MPIAARWRPLATLPARRARDAMPGVYELADANKRLIYIGQSARDVPNRIRQHLEHTPRERTPCVAEQVVYWRYAYSRVPQADEAALLARYRARYGELPLCNRATPTWRDGVRRYQELSRGE